jgi:hypothetical protein
MWPSYTPRHTVAFFRLSRLTGLRWRYSNPPPHWDGWLVPSPLVINPLVWPNIKHLLRCCIQLLNLSLAEKHAVCWAVTQQGLLPSKGCRIIACVAEDVRRSGCIEPVFVTSALVSDWSASRPGLFNSREEAAGTCLLASWVVPCSHPNAVEKRKISSSYRKSNPGRRTHNPSLYWISYLGLGDTTWISRLQAGRSRVRDLTRLIFFQFT